MPNILLLGGTTEASNMARALAQVGLPATYSYAGRTESPADQPIPVRIGGFGGVEGLVTWLRQTATTHVIDATHPFAAQMSANAVAACAILGLPLVALERPAWAPRAGDLWTHVADIDGAVAALPLRPARVFLAIGRQHLAPFAALPHHFILRLVDPPEQPPLPDCTILIARGPFGVAGDTALLHSHRVTHVVAKNAGGQGAQAKLDAARALSVPVILIDRPAQPAGRQVVGSVAEVLAWLHADLGVKT